MRGAGTRLPAVMLIAAVGVAGCDELAGYYLPVSAITRNGFLIDQAAGPRGRGREVRLWGFVDHGNLFGDAGAKRILGEWWSGEGPGPGMWRFNLKAEVDDAVGRSFAAYVLNDAGRDALLRRLVADARARRPTKVFVQGRLLTFDAPTQLRGLTGLQLEVASSRDIRLAPWEGE